MPYPVLPDVTFRDTTASEESRTTTPVMPGSGMVLSSITGSVLPCTAMASFVVCVIVNRRSWLPSPPVTTTPAANCWIEPPVMVTPL